MDSGWTGAHVPSSRGLEIIWPGQSEPELKPRSPDVKPRAHSTPALENTHRALQDPPATEEALTVCFAAG